ncbi:MAG: peptidoglycan-binding protein [Clostridia bacterium]|nr:peptidoglycan-binding protein [Clostridia bacterium]
MNMNDNSKENRIKEKRTDSASRHEKAPKGTLRAAFKALGPIRYLYLFVALVFMVAIPFTISSLVPYKSALAAGSNTINSKNILTAAKVEQSEPETIYSAEPGMVNPIVLDLQDKLMSLSYMDLDEPSDYYSSETEAAIKRFQRTHGLPMTGVADYATFDLLFSDKAKPYSVSEGAEGDDVEELQSRLVELGYLKQATGVFDEATTSAVKLFQKRNNLTSDGTVGENTRETLFSDTVNAYAIYLGEESAEIKVLQTRLYNLGYMTTAPDGKYGKDTVSAVKRFQERNGLISDGYLGTSTKDLLMSGKAVANSIGLGDSGADVTRIQNRLVALGYMKSASGYFGESTVEALKAFQKRNKLTSDGKYGASTSHKLFSSTAVKAPVPKPTNNNNNNSGKNSGSSSGKNSGSSSGKNSGSSSGKNSGSSSGKNTEKSEDTKPTKYSYSGPGSVSALIKAAESRMGCPYVRGAKGPSKFDCSGFVYWCLNNAGVKQGYMTSFGWRSCSKYQRINSRKSVKAGDILVFKGHVAIAISNDMMIDASSSKGKIVKRTSYGTYWDTRWICAYRIF